MKKCSLFLLVPVLTVLTFASVLDNRFNAVFGPLFHPGRNVPPLAGPRHGLDSLHRWNLIAINASGLDHTPVAPGGENRVFGEQLGPGRSSRAMAIVHIAMFDALDAVVGGFTSYTGTEAAHGPMSVNAAISQAAHDTLAAMFPSQAPTFDAYLAEDLSEIRNAHQKANGIDLGQRTAAAILAMRLNDGSEIPEPRIGVNYFPSDQPGHWRQDPISLIPLALGAHWGECMPFVVTSTNQFRAPAPPDMTSAAYTTAYNEVKNLGRDGPPTQRTEEQTFIGIFWAYDGTPSLVRTSETVQSDHGATCRSEKIERHSIRAIASVGKRRHGRCRNDHLGIEILLRFLASNYRHSRIGSGALECRRWQS